MVSEQERAATALFYLDSGCSREEWIKAAMAAKSAGLSFGAFHDWSASAGNYAGESDCRNVWKSISEDGPVTANSLFAMAYAQGWRDPAKHSNAANVSRASIVTPALTKSSASSMKQADSTKAAEVWERCAPAPANHPYIARKGGIPDGLRIYPNDAPPLVIRGQSVAGWLALPCRDLEGNLQTLQFIPEQGDKLNLPGTGFGNGCHVEGKIGDRIYIVEGIGQAWAVHAVTKAAAVVCFGAGRMATVAAALRDKCPSAALVVVPDRGKELQAAEIARAVNGAWVEMPADKPANYDANDYAIEHGADALASLLEGVRTPPMRFNLLSGAELSNAPPMRWMVRGVLPLEGLAALFGPSGSGKSFLVLDVSAAIAGAVDEWFGRRLTHCPVTYVCLEGEAGMGKRIKAWSLHHNKPVPDGLRFITQAFDLLESDDVAELGKAVQAGGGAGGLVILDTLNRAAPGADENSSVDMGNIIAASKQLQSITGGLVLLVHHSGKDEAKGLRGHSSLYAALDGSIKVTKTDTRREWSIDKSKDDETGATHAFKLEVVPVSFDDEGEEVTSCVAVPDDSKEMVSRVKLPQGGNQLLALKALAEPFSKSRDFNKPGAIPGRPCIELEAAVMVIADNLPCEPKRKNERARKALTGLIERGIYAINDGWVWRCD